MSNDETCQKKNYYINYQSQLGLAWLTHHRRYMIGIKNYFLKKKPRKKKTKVK